MGLPAIAGLRRARWFLKTTAIVVTVSFLGLTLQPLALAARLPSVAAPAVKTSPTHEEKLGRALEDIENQLTKLETRLNQRADTATEKARLKTMRQELDALDKQARADFDAIERRLKDKKLPQIILDRHTEAVRTYRSEMAVLKSNLDSLEIAKDDTERNSRTQKAREHLKAKHRKKAHTPVDPNNLPFRVSDSKKTRKPAKKKEDFRKLGLLQEERIQVATTDLLPGMLTAVAALALPAPADLQPTEDVQITPEIQTLAESLNKNPVKIYNWVHNNISFIPTYGSVQGSQMTLETKQGNAFDTASLLIALLRASGVPSHYVYGTVQIPIDEVMNWVGGVTAAEAAQELLGQGGIPNVAIVSGGKIVAIEFEHVWVEAYVDSAPSRGAINRQGDNWIPMDASFKQYQYVQGMDLQSIALDPTTIDQLTNAITVDAQASAITNVNATLIKSSFDQVHANLRNYVFQTNPNPRNVDVLGSKTVITSNNIVLATTLPYRLVVTASRFSALPESIRHYLILNLYSDSSSKILGRPDVGYRIGLPSLGYKTFTLSYDAATDVDFDTLAGNLDSDGAVPAYLIHVKPVLRLAGTVIITGSPVSVAQQQELNITILSPNVPATTQTKFLLAGSYNAIVPQYSAVMPVHLEAVSARISTTRAKLESGDISELIKDNLIGEILHVAGLSYWTQSEVFNRIVAINAKITRNAFQRVGLFSLDLATNYLFGVPIKVKMGPLVSDVRISIETAVALDGDSSRVKTYMAPSLTLMSRLEGTVWKQVTNTMTGGDGITASSLLAQAGRTGIPIYAIDSSNISTILPQLIVDRAVQQDIANGVAAGKVAYVPRDNMTVDGWTGTGYVISDPMTGAAAYLISGGLNGGTVVADLLSLIDNQTAILASFGGSMTNAAIALGLFGKTFGVFVLGLQLLLSAIKLINNLILYATVTCFNDEAWADFVRGLVIQFAIGALLTVAGSRVFPVPMYGTLLMGSLQTVYLYEWGGILRIIQAETYISGQSCRVSS